MSIILILLCERNKEIEYKIVNFISYFKLCYLDEFKNYKQSLERKYNNKIENSKKKYDENSERKHKEYEKKYKNKIERENKI